MSDNFSFYLDTGVHRIDINKVSNSDPYPNNRFSKATITNSPSSIIHQKIDSIYRENYKHAIPDKLSPQIKILPKEYHKNAIRSILALTSLYPDNFCSLIEIYKLTKMGVMQDSLDHVMGYYLKLSPAIRSTPLGVEFNKVVSAKIKAQKAAKSGNPVLSFSVKNNKGKIVNNNTLSGKPYVIAFSATWCIPCQLYQKTLLRLYHKYRPQGLEVIYFNLDDDAVKWNKHIKEKKLDWINVSENTKFRDSEIAKQFNVQAIPLYLIVDKKGKIIYNADEFKDDNYDKLEEYIKLAVAK